MKTYGDYREMLLNKEIDAVMISTPDHWHAQPAIEATLLGKHVYLQKPTSLTIAEGRLLADVVKRRELSFSREPSSVPCHNSASLQNWSVTAGLANFIRSKSDCRETRWSEAPEMPVPKNLNYDMWLGSTPEVYYTEMRVHPQNSMSDRPGWLRCEQFGAGMITGWGQHHFDSAAWGMDTEYTGPITINAMATFPKSGLWDVHGDFLA